MRLVVDTGVLVGDLLRVKGRRRLSDHLLHLFISEHTLAEVHVELARRSLRAGLGRGRVDERLRLPRRRCPDLDHPNPPNLA